MQNFSWYIKRLKTMSVKEVLWRLTSLSAALLEHARVKTHCVAEETFVSNYQPQRAFTPPFRVFIGDLNEYTPAWSIKLREKADKILDNKLSYFDLKDHHLETPINWHKDHATGQYTSQAAILSVNYRDIAINGDCKLVWEPNRHHQFVVLARAYKITGELKYAQGVVTQLTSWLDANPYGYGMNWKNPLELGIRMINWVWAIDLILESGLFSGPFKTRVLNSVFLHCRDISSKFSRGSSANNHLVGEAAGVYIASSYFSLFKDAERWQQQSKMILEREIQAQTFADGCSKEHGFSYQFFVFQFYLYTSQVGNWHNDHFSTDFYQTLNKLAEFIALIAQGGDDYPMLGDQDDGYALDLGDHVHNINALCDLSAYLFENAIFKVNYQTPSEAAFWLFNQRLPNNHQSTQASPELVSRHFTDSGYVLLQAGNREKNNQVSILFDCAELGYTAIAAHGHADALSLIMRLNGKDLLVDSGTYDYYSFPNWRDQFRKTQAHNTIEIDGLDQSVMTGPFMWEQHAQAQLIQWQPSELGGIVAGSHNGYQRLASPLTHERHLDLNNQSKKLVITDRIKTQGTHKIALYFHLSEYCKNIIISENICTLLLNGKQVTLTLPAHLQLQAIKGEWHEDPDHVSLGWVSRSYHQRTPITTLVAQAKLTGDQQLTTVINWD